MIRLVETVVHIPTAYVDKFTRRVTKQIMSLISLISTCLVIIGTIAFGSLFSPVRYP